MKIIILILFLVNSIFSFDNFDKAKKILINEVYNEKEFMECFYTGIKYEKNLEDGQYKLVPINYIPLNPLTKKGNLNYRANRIEWEHIVPAENFGKGIKECRNNGIFIGRKECRKISALFRKMEGDPINLVPSIGEINADRSNYKYSPELAPINSKRGIYIDKKERRMHIPEKLRGKVARAYIHMNKEYNMALSPQEKKLFFVWDKMYPPTNKELSIVKKIENVVKIDEYKNELIKKFLEKSNFFVPSTIIKKGTKTIAFVDAKVISKVSNLKHFKNVKGADVVMLVIESGAITYSLLKGGVTYDKVSSLLVNGTKIGATEVFSKAVLMFTPPPASIAVVATIAGAIIIDYSIDKYIELDKRNYVSIEDMLWDVPDEIKNKITVLNMEDVKKETIFDFDNVENETIFNSENQSETILENDNIEKETIFN